jgi:hypothetical protein
MVFPNQNDRRNSMGIQLQNDVLMHVDGLLPALLQDPDTFGSMTYQLDATRIERLVCTIGRYDVLLNRYTLVSNDPRGIRSPGEPSYIERVLEGRLRVDIYKTRSRHRPVYLATLGVGPGAWYTIRKGGRPVFLMETPTLLSVTVAEDAPVYECPLLKPDAKAELVERFRTHYPIPAST